MIGLKNFAYSSYLALKSWLVVAIWYWAKISPIRLVQINKTEPQWGVTQHFHSYPKASSCNCSVLLVQHQTLKCQKWPFFVLLVSFLLDEDCFILTGSKVQRVINQHHAKRCLRQGCTDFRILIIQLTLGQITDGPNHLPKHQTF